MDGSRAPLGPLARVLGRRVVREEECKIVELLKTCGRKRDLSKGESIHREVLTKGLLEKNPYIASSLIHMYVKCGLLAKAQHLHDEFRFRSLVSWNALLGGYAQQGKGLETFLCLESMQREGFSPDQVTFMCVLKACGSIGAIDKGKKIHDEILRRGLLENNIMLGTALVDMYAKFGMLSKAKQVLEELPVRDVVSWSALIVGYVKQGKGHKALHCFEQMKGEGLSPDAVTFSCILKACGSTGDINKGKQVHEDIISLNLLEKNAILGTALVDMYAKFGVVSKAHEIHEKLVNRSVVSWNALIAGYVQRGQDHEALDCFKQMQNEGFSPEPVTFACILKACASIRDIDKGKHVHEEIVKRGLLEKNIILGTALVDMYAKCGELVKARKVLEELPVRDVVSWSALIAGYTQEDQVHEALTSFDQMQNEGFFPDAITFICVLKACGSIGAIDKGKYIHDEILSMGLIEKNIILGTALVDMYAKCGMLAKAQQILESLSIRDVACWNALIAGYAQQGEIDEALNCFRRMEGEDLSPDAITFLCVLRACGHKGLLDEAQIYFNKMTNKYGITPDLEHHTCMVVVSGCVGQFEKAMSVIESMPSSDHPALWLALLVACRKWGNVELGRLSYDNVIQLDHTNTAAYVLMGSIYTAAGMQEDAEKVNATRLKNAAFKRSEMSEEFCFQDILKIKMHT